MHYPAALPFTLHVACSRACSDNAATLPFLSRCFSVHIRRNIFQKYFLQLDLRFPDISSHSVASQPIFGILTVEQLRHAWTDGTVIAPSLSVREVVESSPAVFVSHFAPYFFVFFFCLCQRPPAAAAPPLSFFSFFGKHG